MRHDLPLTVTHEVRDRCLCLHLQRAARAIGRLFDEALKPVGLTNGQFSILMSLNRPVAPKLSDLARFLAMDRTTLTANLKPLERRGLVCVTPDETDVVMVTRGGETARLECTPLCRPRPDIGDGEASQTVAAQITNRASAAGPN